MRALQRLIRRLSPGRRFAHEFAIASDASALLGPLIGKSASLMGLQLRSIPNNAEINMLLGFIAASHDVFSQKRGGEPSGPGSINGTMKTYQVLFGDGQTEHLMSKTFDLYAGHDADFERGRFYGVEFMTTWFDGDTNKASLMAVGLIAERYTRYCV